MNRRTLFYLSQVVAALLVLAAVKLSVGSLRVICQPALEPTAVTRFDKISVTSTAADAATVAGGGTISGNFTAGAATTNVHTMFGRTEMRGDAATNGIGLQLRFGSTIAFNNAAETAGGSIGVGVNNLNLTPPNAVGQVVWTGTGGMSGDGPYITSSTSPTAIQVNTDRFLVNGTTGAMSCAGGATLGDGTGDAHTFNGQATSAENVGTTGTAGAANMVLQDTTAMAAGVGGAIQFDGNSTGTTSTSAAMIKAEKANGTDANTAFNLALMTRPAGGGALATRIRVLNNGGVDLNVGSTGTTTVMGNLTVNSGAAVTIGSATTFNATAPVTQSGHLCKNGTPAASVGTLQTGSTDCWGTITGIGANTSVTLTFSTTFAARSRCYVTGLSGSQVFTLSQSASAPVISCVSTTTGLAANCVDFSYHCVGQ